MWSHVADDAPGKLFLGDGVCDLYVCEDFTIRILFTIKHNLFFNTSTYVMIAGSVSAIWTIAFYVHFEHLA